MTDNIKENVTLINRTGAKHYHLNKHVLLCFLSFFRFYFRPVFTVVQGCILFVNIMRFSLWSWQHDRKFLRRKYSKFPHNVNCKLLRSLHLCQWGHIDTFNMVYRQALLVDVSWIHKPQQSMKFVLPRGRGHIDNFNMVYRQALLVDVSWIHGPQQSIAVLPIVLPRE